jgi:hypothetical protein
MAISVGNVTIDALVDLSGDCSRFNLETTWIEGAGITNDSGSTDFLHAVIYDGNGDAVLLDDFQWSTLVAPYNGPATIDEAWPHPAGARPFSLKVHDTTFSGYTPLTDILSAPVVYSVTFDPATVAGGANCVNLPMAGAVGVPLECDMRLNYTDCYNAPIAVYGGDTVQIYAIDLATSEGILVVNAPIGGLEAIGPPTEVWSVLILAATNPVSGMPIEIHRLGSGEMQINTYYATGKPYIFVWNPDDPHSGYHLDH